MMAKSRATSDWPKFDSELLREIVDAFQRRRRSIGYSHGISCEREFSESHSGSSERLNFDMRAGYVRLSVWDDGVMWLGVSVSAGKNAGWAFQDWFHGSVLDISPATLVTMVEATLSLQPGSEPAADRRRLRDVWARVGPYSD